MEKKLLMEMLHERETIRNYYNKKTMRKLVYVLDDDYNSANLIKKVCESMHGLDVKIFLDERDYLKNYNANVPDLSIIDYHLSFLDAKDLMLITDKLSPLRNKFFFVTGDLLIQGKNVVNKPIDLTQLRDKIHSYL